MLLKCQEGNKGGTVVSRLQLGNLISLEGQGGPLWGDDILTWNMVELGPMNGQKKSISAGRNKGYKGPEAGKGLASSDNDKTCVAGGQTVR